MFNSKGNFRGLSRFIPQGDAFTNGSTEISTITGFDIFIECDEVSGLCLGFDTQSHCFVSFKLKDPLKDYLVSAQGEIV